MRGVWWGTLFVLGVLLGSGGLLLPAPARARPAPGPAGAPAWPAQPSATPACAGYFETVSSPDPANVYDSKIEAIAARAATDIWAVGVWNTFTTNDRPLIEHWDGTNWILVANPTVGLSSELLGVAVLGANDAWAAGSSIANGTAPRQTLIEHWDGAAWTVVPSPNRGSGDNVLRALAALQWNDIWAVGSYYEGSSEQPLILHWDGSAWGTVNSPLLSPYAAFNTLTAVAADDIWAAGIAGAGANPYQALIEHWDGAAWHVVACPNPGSGSRAFWGIAAAGRDDIWAVGQYNSLNTSLIEHWDGSSWSVVPAPNTGMLNSVMVRAADDVWATGFNSAVLRWDGSAWTEVPSSHPSSDASLQGIAAAGPTLWAAGYYGTAQGTWRALIERDTLTCPTPSATPTPPATATSTNTPTPPPSATPSATGPHPTALPPSTTPTPPPPTATAGPTACPLQFSDVPPGSTFYAFIRCLACRGIVSGYPCGGPGEPCPGAYFRPNNNVTRGQAAKIVAESAGFNDTIPSTRQTFEDVAPGSAFHTWIERLAGRGIIGGYPCGAPGEPCAPPANRPYFRPNAAVTRGQLAQIVAGAAGYTETPTGQTFADVPPGSPFYRPVERLAERAIMSGYPCGGPFEPCVPPGNRPYFRPNTPTTRGQAAKIVANTFLPACSSPGRLHSSWSGPTPVSAPAEASAPTKEGR